MTPGPDEAAPSTWRPTVNDTPSAVETTVTDAPTPKAKRKTAGPSRAGMAKQHRTLEKVTAAAKKAGPLTRRVKSDLSVVDRRWAVVRAMKALRATNGSDARTSDQIAAKSGLTRFDVVGMLYHAHLLQVGGYAKQVKHEGDQSLSYYLTAKGQKMTKEDCA